MADVTRLDIDLVRHVVPVSESEHALYLSDGRVVTFDSYEGTVTRVVHLPTNEELSAAEQRTEQERKTPPRRGTGVPGIS
ncbi:MAG TPA: hypothetical protein VGG84_14945 [Gemmatimonadaceae bacterium]|jgi:hypothetical protein